MKESDAYLRSFDANLRFSYVILRILNVKNNLKLLFAPIAQLNMVSCFGHKTPNGLALASLSILVFPSAKFKRSLEMNGTEKIFYRQNRLYSTLVSLICSFAIRLF